MRQFLVFTLGFVLLAPALRARAADTPAADKVTLDLVVKDKKGTVVPDLRPEEVEVVETGSRRPIESVRFVKPGAAAAGTPSPGNLVSLVFTGMDINQQKRAREAVDELLKHDLGAGTQIAVFRLGLQLWTVQPFTSDLALVRQAVEKAASTADLALAEPDQAARKSVADALAQLQQGKADPVAVSRAEVLGKIIRQGDRLLRQQQEGSPLYFLMAIAKGQATAPGRKTVLYFTGGLTVSGLLNEFFKSTQSEANRAHVAFYAIDVGGLETSSEAQSAAGAVRSVAKASQDQTQKTSGAVSIDDIQVDENVEASTRTNWKQPLKELSENTGGFAVLDSNDYRKPMERVAADLAGYYEVTYAPANPALDGAFRKTEVKVSRGGLKAQDRNGYFATVPDDAGPILAYELPLLEALKSSEPKQDIPFNAGAFRFAPGPEGRDIFLLAELPMSKLKFTTDAKTKTYRMHFALLALVKDAQGKVVERVSQDYPFQGPADKLPQMQQGNVVFKRKAVVPPGRYTVEIVAQDRDSGATSVHRMPLEVPAQPGVALSSVVVVRRTEAAPPLTPGAPEDPLRGEASRIVPSLNDTIQKATTPKLPVYVVVYPQPGESAPPQMTFEFSSQGKTEGRSAVTLPPADADGRIRFLAPIPIDRFGPGEHQLKVTVRQGSTQAEETAGFTLQ
jgi:VWFA-related protein